MSLIWHDFALQLKYMGVNETKKIRNATLSCLLSSRHTIPHGQLRMRIALFYELLKISLTLHTWTAVKTLAYTTELLLNIKERRGSELYRKLIVFLCIVVWHMRGFSPFLHIWGYGAGSKTQQKKRISTSNFKNLVLIIVLANIWRCNMHVILS